MDLLGRKTRRSLEFWKDLAERNSRQATAYCRFYIATQQALRTHRSTARIAAAIAAADAELRKALEEPTP